MNEGVISTRYARAIYKYAAEKGEETVLYGKMQQLIRNFTKLPILREIMDNPTVRAEQKINMLATVGDTSINDIFQRAIRLVVENKRTHYMENIVRMYVEVYRKEKNIVIIQLTTTESEDERIQKDLIPIITKITDGKMDFQQKIAPDMIGGFILEIDDMCLNASVQEQLRIIKYKL